MKKRLSKSGQVLIGVSFFFSPEKQFDEAARIVTEVCVKQTLKGLRCLAQCH